MTNKSTHWVTIPEETVHTPASNPSKKTGKMSKTGKFFWGAGFVIVVVVAVALMAPQQMANILQGNLFEQSGITPLAVIPSEEPAVDETATEPTTPTAEVPAQPEDVTVVQPETEAVTVQVEPAVTEEPVAETTVTEQPTEATPTEVAAETIEVPGAIKEELDANRKLLEELSNQVTEFKEKDQEKTKIIEDLAGMVTEGTMKPAAETLPPAVTTTTALGQVPTGYRANTHTVTISPYETLQKNTAYMEAKQKGAYASTTAQQDYSAQLARAQGTPDSGPREILLVALALAFAAMLGWKISKLART
jgi:hypothetical protein